MLSQLKKSVDSQEYTSTTINSDEGLHCISENENINQIDPSNTEATTSNEILLDDNDNSIVKCSESYKDTLLASLYSQVSFLRDEIKEKNLLIRTLIIT